jgi:hypothetical protein
VSAVSASVCGRRWRAAARKQSNKKRGADPPPANSLQNKQCQQRPTQNYKKQEDADGTGGIVVPLNPLGMRMFDEGERFDLRCGGVARAPA